MRPSIILALALRGFWLAGATPVPQGGSASCPAEALTQTTWTNLGIDTFLQEFASANITANSDNIQGLASAFGAPNFFCGIDQFCNAGQPCLPVQIPAWYAMVAIQNWNSYMNSVNTAINFASSILSLTLPGIVSDFFPDPKDDVTDMKNLYKVFTTILGAVPFTGPLSTAASAVTQGIDFINNQIKTPEPTDKFFAWSNVAGSMASVVSDYHTATLRNFEATLDAPVRDASGILSAIKGGRFLGVSRNITQSQLQSAVTESIKIRSISLVLQAQKIFVNRITNAAACEESASSICVTEAGGSTTAFHLFKAVDDISSEIQPDIGRTLTEKYGISKERFLKDTVSCFESNNKQQLVDPFDAGVAVDPTAPCLFNVVVCLHDAKDRGGTIVEICRRNGGPL